MPAFPFTSLLPKEAGCINGRVSPEKVLYIYNLYIYILYICKSALYIYSIESDSPTFSSFPAEPCLKCGAKNSPYWSSLKVFQPHLINALSQASHQLQVKLLGIHIWHFLKFLVIASLEKLTRRHWVSHFFCTGRFSPKATSRTCRRSLGWEKEVWAEETQRGMVRCLCIDFLKKKWKGRVFNS